jgi:hypothetical protein
MLSRDWENETVGNRIDGFLFDLTCIFVLLEDFGLLKIRDRNEVWRKFGQSM